MGNNFRKHIGTVLQAFLRKATPMEAAGVLLEGKAITIDDASNWREEVTDTYTEAQLKAGNYPKDRLNYQGLKLTIENPKGSLRQGVSGDGTPWQVHMPAHYGYIRGYGDGADGDHPDIYLANATRKRTGAYVVNKDDKSGLAYIVDQVDPDTGKFDEHKIILGTGDMAEAVQVYHGGFSDHTGPARMLAIHGLTIGQLKDWLAEGDMAAPFHDQWEKYCGENLMVWDQATLDKWITIKSKEGEEGEEGKGYRRVLLGKGGKVVGGDLPKETHGKQLGQAMEGLTHGKASGTGEGGKTEEKGKEESQKEKEVVGQPNKTPVEILTERLSTIPGIEGWGGSTSNVSYWYNNLVGYFSKDAKATPTVQGVAKKLKSMGWEDEIAEPCARAFMEAYGQDKQAQEKIASNAKIGPWESYSKAWGLDPEEYYTSVVNEFAKNFSDPEKYHGGGGWFKDREHYNSFMDLYRNDPIAQAKVKGVRPVSIGWGDYENVKPAGKVGETLLTVGETVDIDGHEYRVVESKIEEWLVSLKNKGIPNSLTSTMGKIHIFDKRNPHDKKWEKEYNIPRFKSYATGGRGAMFLWGDAGAINKFDSKSFNHELAHCIQDEIWPETKFSMATLREGPPGWKKLTDSEGFLTSYSKSSKSDREDFAEAFAYYAVDARWLYDKSPAKYAFIHELVKKHKKEKENG